MSYSTIVKEAKFKIGEFQEDAVITHWKRIVERDKDGNPTGVVTFEAMCEPDSGEGRCDLVWTTEVSESGELLLVYECSDVNCAGMAQGEAGGTECVLQYSYDGEEYQDVNPEDPPADKDCFFRCKCG